MKMSTKGNLLQIWNCRGFAHEK